MSKTKYFECPYCKESYQLSTQLEGRKVLCHGCKKTITITFSNARVATPPHNFSPLHDGHHSPDMTFNNNYQSHSSQSYEDINGYNNFEDFEDLTAASHFSSSSHELNQVPHSHDQLPENSTSLSYNNLPQHSHDQNNQNSEHDNYQQQTPSNRHNTGHHQNFSHSSQPSNPLDGDETARLHNLQNFGSLDPKKRQDMKRRKKNPSRSSEAYSSTQYHYSKLSNKKKSDLNQNSQNSSSNLDSNIELQKENDPQELTITEFAQKKHKKHKKQTPIKVVKKEISPKNEKLDELENIHEENNNEPAPFIKTQTNYPEKKELEIKDIDSFEDSEDFEENISNEQAEQFDDNESSEVSSIRHFSVELQATPRYQKPNYMMTFASIILLLSWCLPFLITNNKEHHFLWSWQMLTSSKEFTSIFFYIYWPFIALVATFISFQARTALRGVSVLVLLFVLILQEPIQQFMSAGLFPLLKTNLFPLENSLFTLLFWLFLSFSIAGSVVIYNRPSLRISRVLAALAGFGLLLTLFMNSAKNNSVETLLKMTPQNWSIPIFLLISLIIAILSLINLGNHLSSQYPPNDNSHLLSRSIVLLAFIASIVIIVTTIIQSFLKSDIFVAQLFHYAKLFGFFYSILFLSILAITDILPLIQNRK